MHLYLMFLAMAALTILSPGPSTLKSLTNALNHGLGAALVGMAGLTCGVLVVATLSATSLGMLIAASPTTFELVRYGGVLYLVWLGVKLWRSVPAPLAEGTPTQRRHLFVEQLQVGDAGTGPLDAGRELGGGGALCAGRGGGDRQRGGEGDAGAECAEGTSDVHGGLLHGVRHGVWSVDPYVGGRPCGDVERPM